MNACDLASHFRVPTEKSLKWTHYQRVMKTGEEKLRLKTAPDLQVIETVSF